MMGLLSPEQALNLAIEYCVGILLTIPISIIFSWKIKQKDRNHGKG